MRLTLFFHTSEIFPPCTSLVTLNQNVEGRYQPPDVSRTSAEAASLGRVGATGALRVP